MNRLSFLYIFILSFTLLLSCNNKNTDISLDTISGIHIYNNMMHSLGGQNEKLIKNNKDIKFITKRVNNLKNNINKDVYVNVHYGFFEIKLIDSTGKEHHFIDIVFTKHYGDVVVYKWNQYFYDQELVDYFKKELKIPIDVKPR